MAIVVFAESNANGYFAFVQRLDHERAWPTSWGSRAVLLDFEPSWHRSDEGPQLEHPIREQRWPEDTTRLARMYGRGVTSRLVGPVVGKSFLAGKRDREIHDAFLGFPKTWRMLGREDCRRQRLILHRQSVRTARLLPAFAGIVYLTEADVVFAKSVDSGSMTSYLAEILLRAFALPQNRWMKSAAEELARWLVERGGAAAVRLTSIQPADQGRRFVVRGRTGTGARIMAPALVAPLGAAFRRVFPRARRRSFFSSGWGSP